MKKNKASIITTFIPMIVTVVLILLISVHATQPQAKGPEEAIRVGIFQFEPFNSIDESGKPKGLNIDLLKKIISNEKWDVEYVPGSWSEGLERLQTEKIDLMMSVAHSPERAEIMDYTHESIAELWGQVFIKPGSTVKNINDLKGKRVAVMKRDISATNFQKTAYNLGIVCTYLEYPTHHEVFDAVARSEADAGVAPQHFGLRHTDQYHLTASSIMFSPFSIYFTSKKGRNYEPLGVIDGYLSKWKSQKNSFYYDSLNTWLGWTVRDKLLPPWVWVTLATVIGISVIMLAFIFALRSAIAQKTEELSKSEELYRSFINQANEGIIAQDKDGKITFANPKFLEMVEYDSNQLIGMNISTLFLDEDIEEFEHRMSHRVKGEKETYEQRIKAADGTTRWLQISGAPLPGNGEGYSGAFAMMTDITDRKNIERQQQEIHDRTLTILDSVDSTIYVADIDTHEILFMNKHMKDLFGDNLVGKPCYSALRNNNAPCKICSNVQLLDKDENPLDVQVREDRHPVTRRWNIYREKAIKWVDGRLVRIQVATDISQIKEFELQRRRYERSLHQTQRLETIGTLAGGIAHDFNNILSSIIGNTEIAIDDELDEDSPALESLEQVLLAGQRAKNLIKQLLVFSRQGNSEIGPVRMTDILTETMNLVRATLPSEITVQQNLNVTSEVILADSTEIHQVIMNLCNNAAYAMRELGGVLSVEMCNENIENTPFSERNEPTFTSYLALKINDTGTGMPASMLSKIFDPFFTSKPKEDGTGLGLSVTYGIVKDLGGTINVESTPNKGSTFTVYLPLVDSSEEKLPKLEPVTETGTENILLVDDEAQLANMYQKLLQRQGYTVSKAINGQEALKLFKRDPDFFDIVITDQTMPLMSGANLTTELLRIKPTLPVVLYTGYSGTIDEQSARKLGIKEFLFKPVKIQELSQVIRTVLDQYKKEV